MRLQTLFFLTLFFFTACSTPKNTPKEALVDKELETLFNLMQGVFTSEKQASEDSSYFNISLIMTPIWTERTDGRWLYVEQAVSSNLTKPYRQRVYHLQHPAPQIFTSDIYTIKNALDFAGLQDNETLKKALTFDQIELKEGCTVTLKKENGIYTGGTHEADCPSDLRGATYATTKIILKQGELISWDQGFDANGTQVWGATEGGYIFIKQ